MTESLDTLDEEATIDSFGNYLRTIGRHTLLNAAEEVTLAKQIEAGLFAEKILNGQAPDESRRKFLPGDVAEKEQAERDLQEIATLGRHAKSAMIEANLRLVVHEAKHPRYNRFAMPIQDRCQDGNLGLIRAIEKFDYTKGFKFSTYATWWIRQAIFRGIEEKERMIYLPTNRSAQVDKVVRAEQNFFEKHGRAPANEELAKELGISLKKLNQIRGIDRQEPISLEHQTHEDNDPLGHYIGDADTPSPNEFYEKRLARQMLEEVLATLSTEEEQVASMYYGLKEGPYTASVIARKCKYKSASQVMAILRRATAKLNDPSIRERLENAGVIP